MFTYYRIMCYHIHRFIVRTVQLSNIICCSYKLILAYQVLRFDLYSVPLIPCFSLYSRRTVGPMMWWVLNIWEVIQTMLGRQQRSLSWEQRSGATISLYFLNILHNKNQRIEIFCQSILKEFFQICVWYFERIFQSTGMCLIFLHERIH